MTVAILNNPLYGIPAAELVRAGGQYAGRAGKALLDLRDRYFTFEDLRVAFGIESHRLA